MPAAFHSFSITHLVVVAAYAIALAGLIALGRVPSLRARVEMVWLLTVAGVQAFNVVFWLVPPQLAPASSLPLHVCDLAGLAAAVTVSTWSAERGREARGGVWRERVSRVLRTILLYWGIGLSTQAFVTPVIADGPGTVRFHIFFLSHFTIVGTATYDIVVRGFRPGWRDLGVISLLTLAYGAVVVPLNMHMGWNYGYAGASVPGRTTVIDALGAYPLRLVWLAALVWGVYVALTGAMRLVAGVWPGETGPAR